MMTDDLLGIAHRQVYASFFSEELQSRVNQAFKEREPLSGTPIRHGIYGRVLSACGYRRTRWKAGWVPSGAED